MYFIQEADFLSWGKTFLPHVFNKSFLDSDFILMISNFNDKLQWLKGRTKIYELKLYNQL